MIILAWRSDTNTTEKTRDLAEDEALEDIEDLEDEADLAAGLSKRHQ